jgi:hypothetical protein
MKQIPTLKPKCITRLNKMQKLKKWNEIVGIEVYEAFGFTTSRGSTCEVPLVWPMGIDIVSWK